MGDSAIVGRKPYCGGIDMKNIRGLLAAVVASFGVHAVDFSKGLDFKSNPSKNKPNRVSQKKRRLNQRRKGK